MKKPETKEEISDFKRAAYRNNLTIAEAIASRDYPLTESECRKLLIACGVDAGECSIYACRPDFNA